MEVEGEAQPGMAPTLEQQVAEMLRQMQSMQAQLQTVSQQNVALREEQQRLEARPEGQTNSNPGGGGGGVGTDSAFVSKWAPDGFSGKQVRCSQCFLFFPGPSAVGSRLNPA